MIRLVFLGQLAELAGAESLELVASVPLGIEAIISGLEPDLAAALVDPKIKLAQNGALAARDGLTLAPGDELAFLPPVSGG